MSNNTPSARSVDVAIVGAGPIGIELAVACRQAKLSYQVFEAGSLGNTISWWAPQTRWFSSNERISLSGVPLLTEDQSKATREQYLTYLRAIATQFDLQIQTHTPVTGVSRQGECFAVTTKPSSGREVWEVRNVVLAIGGTDHPNRLGIPGEDLPHVDGYLRETHGYFNRSVLIVGGRNSAVEAALRLHHAGARVALSYRGERLPEESIKYWLLPEIKSFLKSGRIRNLLGTVPTEITSQGVTLASTVSPDDPPIDVAVDDVLSLIGYAQDKTLMKVVGVELVGDALKPHFDEGTMQTNIRGIYVAGTAVAGTQSSKYKIFLENCHDHVDKIIRHITGRDVSSRPRDFESQAAIQPES